jgi:predicted anti-sigma-YlaC factor YlaD
VTCAEVRDHLSEHALGLLEGEESGEVERHLQWCAGCRKESSALLEGAARVALSLPPVEPPVRLEERVVERVAARSGRIRTTRARRAIRVLAVAALAAVLTAGSAVGWGFGQRKQAITAKDLANQAQQRADRTGRLIQDVQKQLKGTGKLYQASLFPGTGKQQAGTVLVFGAPQGAGFALVDVVAPLNEKAAPFTVNLVSSTGRRLGLGVLTLTNNGDYVLFVQNLPQDLQRSDSVELSQVISIEVVDRVGNPVVTGSLHRFIEATPSP